MPRQPKSRLLGCRKREQAPCVDKAVSEDQQGTFYEALDVPDTADTLEIHAAYKRRALATHPDKGGDTAEFQRVLDAFQTLSDAGRRELYDQQLSQPEQDPQHQFGKSWCRRQSSLGLSKFNQRLAQVLQRMSPSCRRDTILQKLNESQRASLEAHLRAEKDGSDKSTSSDANASSSTRATGVYRVSREGGHYAKVFVSGLGLQGYIRKDHVDAIYDHAGLTKVAEHLRRSFLETSSPVQSSELQASLPPGLVASVQVYFYNRHFLGHRHLQLNFRSLVEGLEAWGELQRARGLARLASDGEPVISSAEAAMKQWQRVKETYLRFAVGRRASHADLEAKLLRWEKQHLPTRLALERKMWRRCQDKSKTTLSPKSCGSDGDSALLRCLDRLLHYQARPSSESQHVQAKLLGRKRKCCEIC